jgi:hypothetical protein
MKLPRFSLRLLLVFVALLCAWLAWERSMVMERKGARTRWQRRGDWGGPVPFYLVPADGLEHFHEAPNKPPTVSFVRHILGDEAMQELWIWPGTPEAEVGPAAALFTEARLARFPLNHFVEPASDAD